MEEIRKETVENGKIRDEKGLFVEGNPGGPGRPKGSYSIVELIKKKLEEIPEGKDKTYGEYFVEQIMKKTVVEGDVSMMRDVINRVDGMPKQSIDHTTKGEKIGMTKEEQDKLNALLYGTYKQIGTGESDQRDSAGEIVSV